MGIRTADLVPSDMISVPLGHYRRYAVAALPAYFETHEKALIPKDLLKHQCLRVRLPNGALFRWQFEKAGRLVQIDVDGPIILDEASLSTIAALEGFGIGFFMESDIREDIIAGRLIQVLEDWTPPLAPLYLYYPSRRNPPAAFKALIDLAWEFAASMVVTPNAA